MSDTAMKSEDSISKDTSSLPVWVPLLIGSGIVAAISAAYYFSVVARHADMQTAGQFGDLFGGLNALFSGLAFTAVVIAVFYQGRELSLQRRDLKIAHQSLAAQLEEQRQARKEMESQARFQAYFALANLESVVLGALERVRDAQGLSPEEAEFVSSQYTNAAKVAFLKDVIHHESTLLEHMRAEGYLDAAKETTDAT